MNNRALSTALLVAVVVSGYPLLAALLSLAGAPDTRLPSIVFRIGIAVLSLWVLFVSRKSLRAYNPTFLVALLIFWFAYVARIVNEYFIAQLDMPIPVVEMFGMLFLFVLVPAFAILGGLNPATTRLSFIMTLGVTVLAAVLIGFDSASIATQLMTENLDRLRLERLNPIAIGYVGGTLVVLCAVGLLRPRAAPRPLSFIFFSAGVMGGLFLLLIAASRGPILATVVALVVCWLVPIEPRRLFIGSGVIAALLVGGKVLHSYILREFEFDVFKRFLDVAEGYSGLSRESSFVGAVNQFMESPLFGDALFEKTTGGYVHNLVLEAFMATGIVGGMAYLVCVILMWSACLRLLLRADGFEWLATLSIFFFVAALFSSAHYGAGAHWFTLIAVIVTEAKLRPFAEENRRRRAEKHFASEQVVAQPRNVAEKSLMTPTWSQDSGESKD